MVSARASMATSASIFFARPLAVFMLLVRNASANRLRRPSVRKVLSARGLASMAARRSCGNGRFARAADRRVGRVPAAVGFGGIHLPLAVRRHAPRRGQSRHMIAIDLAPETFRPPRRESLQKRFFIERLAEAVDPSPAQGDVDGFRIGHRRQA